MFHPLTQNMIKAFKFRAQAIFSLLEKTPPPPPGLQNLSSRNFFYNSTLLVYPQGSECCLGIALFPNL
jgi:hypothetical protein